MMKDYELYDIKSNEVQSYIRKHGRIDPSAVKKENRKHLIRTGCTVGDTQLVRDCIDIGVIITDTYLIENSSYYGYYEIVKMLLENGANPFGHGSAIPVSKVRCHYEVHNLLNQYARKYKIELLIKNLEK